MTPDPHERDDDKKAIVRRVLSSGPDPERRLEELLAERRRELDEHAARLRESIVELEKREELLRDSRASVERMLRLGTTELEAREAELTDYVHDLSERESRLGQAEEEVARRRQELGAVELKRATVERRERAVETREERVAELESELEERVAGLAPLTSRSEQQDVELVFVPGERYRLVDVESTPLMVGSPYELDDDTYVVARIARSPLPGDDRRCAYLARGPRAGSFGSS